MPPRSRSPLPPPPPHRRRPRRADEASLDPGPLDRALAAVVPHDRERAFVLRGILEEGPRHHRVASWALLRLLAAVLEEAGGPDDALRELPAEPLGMRLSPGVKAAAEDAEFPLGIPRRLLDRALGDPGAADLAIECLRDGPPHHALANAAMVWLLEAIADRVRAAG